MSNEKLTQKQKIEILTSLAESFKDTAKIMGKLSSIPLITVIAFIILDLLKIGNPLEMWIIPMGLCLSAIIMTLANASKIKANELNLRALIQCFKEDEKVERKQ